MPLLCAPVTPWALYCNYLIISLYDLLYLSPRREGSHWPYHHHGPSALSVVNISWMKELCSAQIDKIKEIVIGTKSFVETSFFLKETTLNGSPGKESGWELCLFGTISLIVLSDHEIFQFLIFWLELPISGFILENKTQTIFRITSCKKKKKALKNPEAKYGHNDRTRAISQLYPLAELHVHPCVSRLTSTGRIHFFLIGGPQLLLHSLSFSGGSPLPPIGCLS